MFKATPGGALRGQPVAQRRGGSPVCEPLEAGAGGPLENTANNVSPFSAQSASDKGKRRWEVRYFLWEFSHLGRVRLCGRRGFNPAGGVAVRKRPDQRASFAGVQTCGSVWACPFCNAKVMRQRGLEIAAAVELHQAQGGKVAFLTFTLRHKRVDLLSDLWDVLGKAWRMVISGKAWTKDKASGVIGFVKVVEVTFGRNGWHVHIHVLVFLSPEFTADQLVTLHRSMFRRWLAAVVRLGLDAPALVGQDARLINGAADEWLGAYLSKAVHGGNVGQEFTNTQSKGARSALSTRPVWSLLDEAADGIDSAVRLWGEWERASKGRKQVAWSNGLRDLLKLGKEASDEEVAAVELGSELDDLAIITAAGYQRLNQLRLNCDCLEAANLGDEAGLIQFLNLHSIDHERVSR